MQHANCVPSLAAGMKSLPSGQSGMADTQALWRFMNNPRVRPVDLSAPLLSMARQGIQEGCQDYALAVHDWSRLNFRSHDRKPDRVRMTHKDDVGYELQSTVLVTDRDGSPICAPAQNLRTAKGLLSSRADGVLPMKAHLDELSERVAWLEHQALGRTAGAHRGSRSRLDWAFASVERAGQPVAGAGQSRRAAAVAGQDHQAQRCGRAAAPGASARGAAPRRQGDAVDRQHDGARHPPCQACGAGRTRQAQGRCQGCAVAGAPGGQPSARRGGPSAGRVVSAEQRGADGERRDTGAVVLLALAHRVVLQAAQAGWAASGALGAGKRRGHL